MTTGLQSKAHRLVELARGGDDPSAAQLLSLHGAVAARIAAEGASAASAATVSTKAAAAGAILKGLVVAGAITTGAAGFLALKSTPEAAALRSVTTRAALPRPAVSEPAASVALGPVPPAETSAPAMRQPSRPPNASLRLQDEAALLAEVQGALRNGQAAVALAKLESYDRRFPAGMLRSEADAAKVFALCGAGKAERARAAAARFVQRYPNAPATARVQSACK